MRNLNAGLMRNSNWKYRTIVCYLHSHCLRIVRVAGRMWLKGRLRMRLMGVTRTLACTLIFVIVTGRFRRMELVVVQMLFRGGTKKGSDVPCPRTDTVQARYSVKHWSQHQTVSRTWDAWSKWEIETR